MIYCKECDKKLDILEGHHHALGKRFLVCKKCYTKVEKDMVKWSKFCLSGSFNAESFKIDIQEQWNKNLLNDLPLQKWFNNLWVKLY